MNVKQQDANFAHLYLLSKNINFQNRVFNQFISNKEEEEFYNQRTISMKIIDVCIYSFLSVLNENKKNSCLQSLYIIFEDYLVEFFNNNKRNDISKYINKDILIQKRNVFIPIYRNNKWSLIVIENIYHVFVDEIIDQYYKSNYKYSLEKNTKFRIMVISPHQEIIPMNTIFTQIEKLFIFGGLTNEKRNMLFNKQKLEKEIRNINTIVLPNQINAYETGLVLLELIQNGMKSISINLYLNSLLNTVFDSEYFAEVKINLYPKIQRILQSNTSYEGKMNRIPKHKKNNAIKEIPITYSADKSKKSNNLIYRKTVVPKNPLKKQKALYHNKDITNLINNNSTERRCIPIDQKSNNIVNTIKSQPRNTYNTNHIIQSKEQKDISQYFSTKSIKEEKIELSPKQNENTPGKNIGSFNTIGQIYHHKNISTSNMKYLQINSKEISLLSQPTIEYSSNNIQDSTNVSILNQNTNNKTKKSIEFGSELFIKTDCMIPKAKQYQWSSTNIYLEVETQNSNSIKKKKSTEKKYNSFVEVRDYSSYNPNTEENNNNNNDPCGKCGGNKDCLIF